MNLAWLAILLGTGFAALQVYGLKKPQAYREVMRSFPRSASWGTALMLVATAWFLWNLQQENISDFAKFKRPLMAAFGAVGVGACFYLRDYLAVRGLAILFLLLGKLMVDTAQPCDSSWRLVMVTWAYGLVIVGMWWTVVPYRMRDWIQWTTETDVRLRLVLGLRLAFGLGIAVLGLTAYRV